MTKTNCSHRALLLGGTGAMGAYLQDELASGGWDVVVTSRCLREPRPGVTFAEGNAKDPAFLASLASESYNVVVDFMTWTPQAFEDVLPLLLGMSAQYVFLSSYRVFADAQVITESSPRLLEACPDRRYAAGGEYAIAKAREEDTLRASGSSGWTIVRPAITYSKERFQLGTLEAGEWLWRALRGLPVPMAREVLERECTLSWGLDVARMIARLLGNPAAYGEDFNVSTSKHQPWAEVLGLYRDMLDFEVREVPLSAYERYCCWGDRDLGYCPQLRYDRLVDRVLDNSKVLAVTGMREDDLAGIGEGLAHEFGRFLHGPSFPAGTSAYSQGGAGPRMRSPGVARRSGSAQRWYSRSVALHEGLVPLGMTRVETRRLQGLNALAERGGV